MIGANGAGKSTTIRAISGLVRPRQGQILFEEKPLHTLPRMRLWRWSGTGPEGRRVFAI